MALNLSKKFPWLKRPVVVSAPMLGAATPSLAINVTSAGGIGFLAGGTSLDALNQNLEQTTSLLRTVKPPVKSLTGSLPIGVGFQLWSCKLDVAIAAVEKHKPAIVWLYAPTEMHHLQQWAIEIRRVAQDTHIWVQIGNVAEARLAMRLAKPDVLVVQGSDAGGHGLAQSASVISLVPEILDMLKSTDLSSVPVLAAGGIAEGRGVAGALALGASGVVMGTRFLAAREAGIPTGWQKEIIRADDGGVCTSRSTLCDRLKETKGWPAHYDGRAITNKGHEDEKAGMPDHQNVALYKEEAKQGDDAWGPQGRMVTYAGTGVGLIDQVKSAAAIVEEVHNDTRAAFERAAGFGLEGGARSRL